MITSRTKKQLLVFVLITLVGVSFVGARYARLDRIFYDADYTVTAHFSDSGGIFTDAEVTYRGVHVGKVEDMELTRDGVDVVLSIDNGFDRIPAQTDARVANKSAVGEQYIDLEPRTDAGPYLEQGSEIDDGSTEVPVSTTELLTNLDNLVNSVPRDKLRTVVSELGAAFKGAGPSLTQIIDTSTAFIETANENFDVTTRLIRDSGTVLRTQVDKISAIRAFSRDLRLFSDSLAGSDRDLRKLIDTGSATANELRTFLERNEVDLGRVIADLVTTGEVTIKHLKGLRQILVLYPYMVAGGYTVTAPSTEAGQYDAHFGLVLTQAPPVCHAGYDPDEVRTPNQRDDIAMDEDAHCAEPPTQSVPRGGAHAPEGDPVNFRPGVGGTPSVATYDRRSGKVTWSDERTGPRPVDNGVRADLFGKDSWKWMLLQPALPTTRSAQE